MEQQAATSVTEETAVNNQSDENNEDILGIEEEGPVVPEIPEQKNVIGEDQSIQVLNINPLVKQALTKLGLDTLKKVRQYTRIGLMNKGLSEWHANATAMAMKRAGYQLPHVAGQKTGTQAKKPHWTQTKEGRARVSKHLKKLARKHHDLSAQKKVPFGQLRISEACERKLAASGIHSVGHLRTYSKKQLNGMIGEYFAGIIVRELHKIGKNLPMDSGHVILKKSRKVVVSGETGKLTLTSLNLPSHILEELLTYDIHNLKELLQHSYTQLESTIGQHPVKLVAKRLKEVGLALRREYKGRLPKEVREAHKEVKEDAAGKQQEYIGYLIGYAHRDCKERIHELSQSSGGAISWQELARRVGELLFSEKDGQILGAKN